jgi:hypothetical protein
MEPYYTQANYFFASLVIVTLPVMVWEKRVKPGGNIFGSLPCFLFLAVFYIRIAYVKSHPGWLPGGDAMASLAGTPLIVTSLGREFFSLGWAQAVIAPGVVGIEFLLGIGILGSIFSLRLRRVVAAGMVVFHFALGLFMDIGYFPIFSLLAAAAIFPDAPHSKPIWVPSQAYFVGLLLLVVCFPYYDLHSYDIRRWVDWDLISYPSNEVQDVIFMGKKNERESELLRFNGLPHSFTPWGKYAGPLWHFYFMDAVLRQEWVVGKQEFPMKKFVRYLCQTEGLYDVSVRVTMSQLSSGPERRFDFSCR